MAIRKRAQKPATSLSSHADSIIKDALSELKNPARRLLGKRILTLGGIAMLSGCDLSNDKSVNTMLRRMSFFNDDVQARGVWVTGSQLAPPRRARSVRVRNGQAFVTDGPFAETKEMVGGFDILECASFEDAVSVAARHPVAQVGTIELRPLWGG